MHGRKTLLRAAVAGLACAVAWAGLGAVPSGAQDTAVAPTVVDVRDREVVRRLFLTTYRATQNIPHGWTGNLANCQPGTLAPAYLAAVQTRVNWFRAMAGVSSTIELTAENNRMAQAAGFLQAANPTGGLDHNPPATWRCFTAEGGAGSAASNLGGTGPDSIDGWMQDPGANNRRTGHRRHILSPAQRTMGHGGVPGGSGALYVFAPGASPVPPARDEFVAWPPAGFVPSQTVYGRWSFSLPPTANIDNATVSMRRADGTAAPLTVVHRESNSGFSDSALVWHPTGLVDESGVWPTPANDERFTVTVAGVVMGGATRTFTYDVTIFDPLVGDPARTPVRITGPATPPVGQPARYEATTAPNAIGYQRRTITLATPPPLPDGAEGGAVNVDAVINEYNPISTAFAATGTSSFRLSIGQPGPRGWFAEQTLTFKPVIVPSATSQLTFQSRAVNQAHLINSTEVSTDGGATWRALFEDRTANDAAFVARSVPLGTFADQLLQLRFRSRYSFNGQGAGGGEGWFFDDVAVSDAVAGPATFDDAGTDPSFSLTPTSAAVLDIAIRPRFFGDVAGVWGPAIRVAPVPPAVAPAITTQPQAVRITAGAAATFTAAASGTAPLAFVWTRDGTDLADGAGVTGTRTATLRLENVTAAQAGAYAVRVSNTAGTVTSNAATLTVDAPAPPPSDAAALASAVNNFGANWSTSGDAPWTSQTAVSRDGVRAARSGPIGDGQRSTLEATRVTGPATVSFWWKVDSEANFDFVTVEVNGVPPFAGISGNVDWQQRTLTVPAGTHTLRWHYSKDGSVATGQDAGWVDQVTITPMVTPPAPPPTSPLATALGTTNVVTTAGDSPWSADTGVSRDGVASVRSGRLADGQASRVSMVVTGPATVSFWWKIDSEGNFDFLTVDVGGQQPFAGISGNVDWQQRTLTVPAGTHTLTWAYTKDGSVATGQDAAWIDQLTVT